MVDFQKFNAFNLLTILTLGLLSTQTLWAFQSTEGLDTSYGGDGDVPYCYQLQAPDQPKEVNPELIDFVTAYAPSESKNYLPLPAAAPEPTLPKEIDITDGYGHWWTLSEFAEENEVSEKEACEGLLGESYYHENIYLCGKCLPLRRVETDTYKDCNDNDRDYFPSSESYEYGTNETKWGCEPYVVSKSRNTQKPYNYCDATCPCKLSDENGTIQQLDALLDRDATGVDTYHEDVYQKSTQRGVVVVRTQVSDTKHSVECGPDYTKRSDPKNTAQGTWFNRYVEVYNNLKKVTESTTTTYFTGPLSN